MATPIQPLPWIYLLTTFLLPLCSAIDSPLHRHAHLPRQAVTVTETATATAPALTSTATATETATSTSTPLTAPSNSGAGPTSSPLIFFIVLALGIILIIIGFFFIIYCIKKRRAAAREDRAAAAPRQGHELQSTSAPVEAGAMQAQPSPAQEVYGYYAPVLAPAHAPGLVTEIGAREEAARGKREVYG